jgi:putative transposase
LVTFGSVSTRAGRSGGVVAEEAVCVSGVADNSLSKELQCLQELRWLYDRRELAEARQDLARWLGKWQTKHPKLCDWVEENIEETLTYFCLPQQHHKHMKSTNMLERQNQELKRRTHVVRIFPNAQSCLRLVRALAVETHENWLEAIRYLNMAHLAEHKKEALRMMDDAA